MHILNDSELLFALKNKELIIKGLVIPDDPYDKSSPIQPCSLDLHIGEIYIPPKEDTTAADAAIKSHLDYEIKAGETAVVITDETVVMPNNLGAIGFAPAQISGEGLLMTDAGHIDPGFEGQLKFTVINMGKKPYLLKKGERVVTLLIFKLNSAAKAGYKDRTKYKSMPNQIPERLNKLARDFLNFRNITAEIAETAVIKGQLRTPLIVAAFTLVGTIAVALIAPLILNFASKSEVVTLKQRVDVLDAGINLKNLQHRIEELEKQK